MQQSRTKGQGDCSCNFICCECDSAIGGSKLEIEREDKMCCRDSRDDDAALSRAHHCIVRNCFIFTRCGTPMYQTVHAAQWNEGEVLFSA